MELTTEKRTTISCVMIVKNEEIFLEKCLLSVKDCVDEIIIVDTGSTDGTVEIAKRYTNKIYFHPWEDSFSKARNQALQYSSCEWVFQIDADEILEKCDIPVLSKAVRNQAIDAIMVQIVSVFRQGESEAHHNVERIFRNNGKIHYEGRVHNRLIGFEKPQIYPIRLFHYGYDLDDPKLSEKKHQRLIKLLNMDIKDDPRNPLPYHYLGCCYLPRGLYQETLDVSLKAIELAKQKNDKNPIFLWSRYNAAMAYYQMKDYRKAAEMAQSALEIEKNHIDSHFVLTLVTYELKNWSDTIIHGEQYLKLCTRFKIDAKDFGAIVASTTSMEWNALVLLGISYAEKGYDLKSREAFQSAISNAHEPFVALRAIGLYYHNKGQLDDAILYLERAADLKKDDPTTNEILDKIMERRRRKTTISCCMIVKNEEEFLEQCLNSVKNYVDEIIVVDTGSTDNTVEIAKKFTDKVYFHPWENSFSKARNHALKYAKGDWIFQIDADEELLENSGEKLRQVVENVKDEDIILVNIFCSYSNGKKKSLHNFERLFRNNGKIHYEGSVHNRVIGGTKAFYSSIELWHYGYDVDEEKSLEKFKRTTDLLKKEIDKDPENPMYHHYLCVSYFSKGMNEDAMAESIRAIDLSDAQDNDHPLYSWSHFIASMSSYHLGYIDQAKNYALKSLKKYPDHLDSFYLLTIIAAEEADWEGVFKFGNAFIDMLKKYQEDPGRAGLIINNTMNEGPAVYLLMGHAYHAGKSYREMKDFYVKAYETATKEKWRIWWDIGSYHMDKSGDLQQAREFFDLALKEAPEEHDSWYMLAKLNNKENLFEYEIECLEKVVEIGTKDDFVFNRLFSLYIGCEQHDAALNLINNPKTLNPSIYSDLIKLGNIFIKKNDLESGIQCYMKAVKIRPKSPEAWSILGEITLAIDRLEDSEIFFERAFQIDDHDIATIIALCELNLKKRDIESHIKYCDILLGRLCLPRARTIDNFEDLRSIFMEIESALNIDKNHAARIANIIEQLPVTTNSIAHEMQG